MLVLHRGRAEVGGVLVREGFAIILDHNKATIRPGCNLNNSNTGQCEINQFIHVCRGLQDSEVQVSDKKVSAGGWVWVSGARYQQP